MSMRTRHKLSSVLPSSIKLFHNQHIDDVVRKQNQHWHQQWEQHFNSRTFALLGSLINSHEVLLLWSGKWQENWNGHQRLQTIQKKMKFVYTTGNSLYDWKKALHDTTCQRNDLCWIKLIQMCSFSHNSTIGNELSWCGQIPTLEYVMYKIPWVLCNNKTNFYTIFYFANTLYILFCKVIIC